MEVARVGRLDIKKQEAKRARSQEIRGQETRELESRDKSEKIPKCQETGKLVIR